MGRGGMAEWGRVTAVQSSPPLVQAACRSTCNGPRRGSHPVVSFVDTLKGGEGSVEAGPAVLGVLKGEWGRWGQEGGMAVGSGLGLCNGCTPAARGLRGIAWDAAHKCPTARTWVAKLVMGFSLVQVRCKGEEATASHRWLPASTTAQLASPPCDATPNQQPASHARLTPTVLPKRSTRPEAPSPGLAQNSTASAPAKTEALGAWVSK